MVKLYEPQTKVSDPMSLDRLIERLREQVDCDDPTTLEQAAFWLQDLISQPDFLWDQLARELQKIEEEGEPAFSFYGANSFILHDDFRFYLRANFWAPLNFISEGTEGDFAFELPHDHNFDFITIGWGGPGYTTRLFSRGRRTMFGVPGEKLDLCHTGDVTLSPGKVLLFHKGSDIHTQLPPPALSLSLNVIVRPCPSEPGYQYAYDVDRGRILGRMNPVLSETLVYLARCFDNPDLLPLMSETAAAHPCSETRIEALKYLELSDPKVLDYYSRGPISPVTHYARKRSRELQAKPMLERHEG